MVVLLAGLMGVGILCVLRRQRLTTAVILVVMVLIWGFYKAELSKVSIVFPWPGLDKQIVQMQPVTPKPTPYAAVYRFDWLSASGTACLIAAILSALLLRVSPRQFLKILAATSKQLALSMLTIASVLALAFLLSLERLFERDFEDGALINRLDGGGGGRGADGGGRAAAPRLGNFRGGTYCDELASAGGGAA